MKTLLVTTMLFCCCAPASMEAKPEAAYVPDETPFVAVLNVPELMRQPMVKRLINQEMGEQDIKHLEAIGEALGIDLERDFERALVFGEIGPSSNIAVAIEGKFDSQRLLAMAALTPGYTKSVQDNAVIHHIPESGKPYLALINEEMLILADTMPQLEASLKAWEEDSTHVEAAMTELPAGEDPLLFWIYGDHPDLRELELPGILGKATYERILVRCAVSDEGWLNLEGRLTIKEEEYAVQTLHGLRGYLALSQIMLGEGPLKEGLAAGRIEDVPGEPGTITISVRLPQKAIEDLLFLPEHFDKNGQRIYGVTGPTGQTHP